MAKKKKTEKNKCVLASLDQQFSGVMDIYVKGRFEHLLLLYGFAP
jgi:hypothetical protein